MILGADREIEAIAVRFLNVYSHQFGASGSELIAPAIVQRFPDHNGDVFRRRDQLPELRQIHVNIAIREPAQNLFRYEPVELPHIEEKPCLGIDGSAGGHLQLIIMTVTVRVVALSEDARVFVVA